jgi:hypothetical protein
MAGRADETDTAFALFTPGAIPAGLATEIDIALALAGQQNGRGWRADRSLQSSARSQQETTSVRRNNASGVRRN